MFSYYFQGSSALSVQLVLFSLPNSKISNPKHEPISVNPFSQCIVTEFPTANCYYGEDRLQRLCFFARRGKLGKM